MDNEKIIADKPVSEKISTQKGISTDKVYEKLLELEEKLTRIEARLYKPLIG